LLFKLFSNWGTNGFAKSPGIIDRFQTQCLAGFQHSPIVNLAAHPDDQIHDLFFSLHDENNKGP
jgi:hypothetical protein